MSRLAVRYGLVVGLLSLCVAGGVAQQASPTPGAAGQAGSAAPADKSSLDGDHLTPVEKALASETEFDFASTPLRDVAKAIGDKHGINVLLDTKNLSDAGITPDTELTHSLKGISLRSALALMLGEKDMGYLAVSDNSLLITTDVKSKEHTVVRVYEVGDLLPPAGPARVVGGYEEDRSAVLLGLITTVIRPPTWLDNGGSGSITFRNEALIVSQTPETHCEIARLLAMLRLAKANPNWASSHAAAVTDAGRAAEDRIEKALDRKLDVDFPEISLHDLRDWVANQIKMSVELDLKPLSEAGVTPDTDFGPFQAKQIPLRCALNQILAQREMSIHVDDESVIVTTRAKAIESMVLRIYPVGDLAGAADAGTVEVAEQDFINTITSGINPPSWSENGGPGTIAAAPIVGALAISHTNDVHERIAKLLTDLRAAKKHAAASEKPVDENEPVTRIYVICGRVIEPAPAASNPAKNDNATNQEKPKPATPEPPTLLVLDSDLDNYIAAIRSTVARGSWDHAEGNPPQPIYSIGKAGERIVVRHTPKVQAEVTRMFIQLGAINDPTPRFQGTSLGGKIPRNQFGTGFGAPAPGQFFGGGAFCPFSFKPELTAVRSA